MRLEEARAGGKAGVARALAQLERHPTAEPTLVLLDEAWADPGGLTVGLTGPPGVGKSTLAAAMVRAWRARGMSVGVIAVDPSSRRSGGALLGDRTRIDVDPDDPGVFIRSMAARERLGGLADLCAAAVTLFRAVFEVTLVETVGVGQSETEVGELVDLVVLAVQPASGDALQFMKAGITETPDVIVVTKADLGAVALRAKAEIEVAAAAGAGRDVPVLLVGAVAGSGIDALMARLRPPAPPVTAERRAAQGEAWLRAWVRDEHGRRGLARAAPALAADPQGSPFRRMACLSLSPDG